MVNIFGNIVGDLALGAASNFVNSLGNGFLGSIFGGNSSKQQYKYQSKLQQQQYDLQKQMFDYTSEYYNDSNRIQRMKDAGLNPNLAYGQTSPAGSTGSVSSGQAGSAFAQLGSSDLAGYIGAQARAKGAVIDNDLKKSQGNFYDAQTAGILLSNVEKSIKNKYAKEMLETQLDLMKNKAQNYLADTNLKREYAITEVGRRYNIKADTMNKIAQFQSELMRPSEIASRIAVNYADVGYKKALTAATTYSIDVMTSQIGLNNALAFLNLSKREWQALRNADYEKFTEKELKELDAKIFNYYKTNGGFNGKLGIDLFI